tara:strand:+ start:227 stop:1057 length:831 start_codon:yes stop_codon:yes gene_type:complete
VLKSILGFINFFKNGYAMKLTDKTSRIITELSNSIYSHDIFKSVNTVAELRFFMQIHVFAVLDFMTLLKRLQNDLTCCRLPWVAPKDPIAARLINEIVLQEESDEGLTDGVYTSHFELYLGAMGEIGADVSKISYLCSYIKESGSDFDVVHALSIVPREASELFSGTWKLAQQGDTVEVLASFLLGREEIIPQMFAELIQHNPIINKKSPSLLYYLQRHIDLDGSKHSKDGWVIADRLIGQSESAKLRFEAAAILALENRLKFWDSISTSLINIDS